MDLRKHLLLIWTGILLLLFSACEQDLPSDELLIDGRIYPIYPEALSQKPEFESPYTTSDSIEVVVVGTINDSYTIMPVTVENGAPLLYSRKVGNHYGKDDQLSVDSGDFPALAATGLHSESDLDQMEMITGIPIPVINCIAKPAGFSWAGFIAEDEDIISVLKGDNRLVTAMGFTHPQVVKPLFHVWNMILNEIQREEWRRFDNKYKFFFYHGKTITLEANGSRGWQISIFQDEIQGNFNIHVYRDLSDAERSYLTTRYGRLSEEQFDEMVEKLSHIHMSEMVPYYVRRYGFYEGHTSFRADPIAVAFIFGLKSLEEIEDAFAGTLYEALTNHFTRP